MRGPASTVWRAPRLARAGARPVAAAGFQPLGLVAAGAARRSAASSLLIERARSWRGAALLGWLFGLAHFTFANNWIATAFTYQAQMPPALGWAAVPLLSLYLAVYPALAAAGAQLVARRAARRSLLSGVRRLLDDRPSGCAAGSSPAIPWNPFGVVLLGAVRPRPGLAAARAVAGNLCAVGPGGADRRRRWSLALRERRWLPRRARRACWCAAAMYCRPRARRATGTLRFTLVQPEPAAGPSSNDRGSTKPISSRLAELSLPRRPGDAPAGAVARIRRARLPARRLSAALTITRRPRSPIRSSPAGASGASIGPGSLLLTGAVDLKIAGGRAVGAYNAVTALDRAGQHRRQLRQGASRALRRVSRARAGCSSRSARSRLVGGSIDFIPGPGPRTLDLGAWGKAGVQVCYEIVFSGQVVDRAHRPDYIFNPSNDGWFGASGPPQHLAQARLRAIEEGLPVLRATTTGISAVIDARGVVRAATCRRTAPGAIDGLVPPRRAADAVRAARQPARRLPGR